MTAVLHDLEVQRPETVAQALRVLRMGHEEGEPWRPMAGCTDVLVEAHFGKPMAPRWLDVTGLRADLGGHAWRSDGLWLSALTTYTEALDDVVVVLMIEKRQAVENLEAILKVPGIDMVQFGGSDYSMSMGLTGQRNHPEVKAAERKTIETALKLGLHPRIELADIKDAAPYLEMGVKHFCIGWDVRILADWWDAKGAEMRKMLRSKPPKAKSAPSKAPARKGNGRDVVRGNYT